MKRLALFVASLFACASTSAAELVRVRVSQFEGSEPATLSSESHPHLFVLDPRIAFAELVATNPADPRKEDHGLGTWLPVLTPPEGQIRLRVTPATGEEPTYGALHFRSAALVPGAPASLGLAGFGSGFEVTTERAKTVTRVADELISDAPVTFYWNTAENGTGAAGGAVGFRNVDLVLATPVCELAPREDCQLADDASLRMRGDERVVRLTWRFAAADAVLDPLGGADAAPLVGWCLYGDGVLRRRELFGPDVWHGLPSWTEQPHRVAYRRGEGRRPERLRPGDVVVPYVSDRLVLRSTAGRVIGALSMTRSPPPGAVGFPGPPRIQLVRSDDGACFDATTPFP